jgi:hypothetical protein
MILVAIIVEEGRQTLLSTQISINQRQVFVDCETVVSELKNSSSDFRSNMSSNSRGMLQLCSTWQLAIENALMPERS